MENKTETMYFVLAAYGDTGELKYVYFGIILFWFLSIWMMNSVLILIIYKDKKLHEPMYMLLCNLFVNELNGSASLYPLMLSQMLSDTHQVTVPWCFLQMCYIYASASLEFCSLAAMAYDSLILFSYLKILTVCLKASKENTQKAISTCTPQIVSLSNLFLGSIFHFSDSRVDVSHAPDELRVMLSMYIFIIQPMLTPFMYGLKLPKIRQSCKIILFNHR
eukprot:XP_011609730.1 PREDICTED: olfactory receptor 7G2-like [Takifugu rubripes]